MPRPKQLPKEEIKDVTVVVAVIPYYAAVSTHPSLSGLYGVGPSPEKAVISLRSVIARKFPHTQYNVTEILE
jgi:hypothetical protein